MVTRHDIPELVQPVGGGEGTKVIREEGVVVKVFLSEPCNDIGSPPWSGRYEVQLLFPLA